MGLGDRCPGDGRPPGAREAGLASVERAPPLPRDLADGSRGTPSRSPPAAPRAPTPREDALTAGRSPPQPTLGFDRIPEGSDLRCGAVRKRLAHPSHAVLDVAPSQHRPPADPQCGNVGSPRLALLNGRGVPQ